MFTFLFPLKSEFLKGLYCHLNIFLSPFLFLLSVLHLLIAYKFDTINPLVFFESFGFITSLSLICHKNYRSVGSLILHLLFTRIIFWSFLSYVDINFLILLSPIILTWYIFDPYYIVSSEGKQSPSTRFNYFISRYPFFYGYGIPPTIILFLILYLEFSPIFFFPFYIFLLSHKNYCSVPLYACYLPYSKLTFSTDIIDIFSNFINTLIKLIPE